MWPRVWIIRKAIIHLSWTILGDTLDWEHYNRDQHIGRILVPNLWSLQAVLPFQISTASVYTARHFLMCCLSTVLQIVSCVKIPAQLSHSSLRTVSLFLCNNLLLEKEMATHSNILAWRIPWTEEPGGLQSLGSQRVRHDWATNTITSTEIYLQKWVVFVFVFCFLIIKWVSS